jgi:hypothetical protein
MGIDSEGTGTWTASPQRENVTISPDACWAEPLEPTASTGRDFPRAAMNKVSRAMPDGPVPERLIVDWPSTV